MAYTLSRLAPGSYDVLLNGVIVAGLVRSGETNRATWTAELLVDVHPRRRPAPFMRPSTHSAAWRRLRDGLEMPKFVMQAGRADLCLSPPCPRSSTTTP